MAQIVTLEAQRQADNAARQHLELSLRAAQVGDTGYVRLIARHSLKCLDKTAWNWAVQWQCWGNAEEWQHWRFAYIGGTP